MIDNELQGSWDQPTRTIVMQNMDATHTQQLAMQFTDKAMVRARVSVCKCTSLHARSHSSTVIVVLPLIPAIW